MQNLKSFSKGQEVVRSKGDYVVGYTGTVVDVDLIKRRAQVDWNQTVKTWVSFDALELTSIPYEIIRQEPKKVKGFIKHFNPKYRKL